MWQTFDTPTSIQETLEILARHEGQAQIIAGGTDLTIELREGKYSVGGLVDVTRIPGLKQVEQKGDWIVLGANVTFRQLKESDLMQQQARVLAEAAATVGALQIQTMATIAGNVVSALPAADGCVALLALGAEAQVVDENGSVWRPIEELFLGPGKSAIDPTRQMLTAIRFRVAGPGQGSAWERIGRRRALVLPILNCAVNVALSEDGEQLAWAKIGLGPVAPVPFRARETEAFLAGRRPTQDTIEQAAKVAAAEARPRTSLLRASKEYRIEVLKVLVSRGLERAVAQAQERLA